MDGQIDIRSWKVFRSLDSAFVANIRMAMVVGLGEAGIIVTRNDDAFSIGKGILLGLKDASEVQVPVKVAEISGIKIKGIYSGCDFVIVLTENGQLFTWGLKTYGQLGLGKSIASAPVPTRLRLPNDELVVEVACGWWHTLALTASGKVYSWGSNPNGEVSKLLPENVCTPVDALNEDGLGRSQVVSVACSRFSSFALRSDGRVWAWGQNYLTGLGTNIEPTVIPVDFEVTKIVCGSDNVLVLDKEGHLYRWGCQDPNIFLEKPTTVPSELGQVLDIAATWRSSLNVFCTKSGVYFWGTWLGQEWKCPSPSNFPSMDIVFAMDQGPFSDSIMCRPLHMNEQEGSLIMGFSEKFNTHASADVQFKMQDDRVIFADRVVLTSRSPYFNKKFNEDWKDRLTLGKTKISVESVDPDTFHSFIHYLYKGRLDEAALQDRPGRSKRILDILRMSHEYGQMDLFTDCEGMLIPLVNIENACEMFQAASEFIFKDLEDRTLEVMAPPNFYKIVQTDAPPDVIKLIAKKLSDMRTDDKHLPKVPLSVPLDTSTVNNPERANNFFKI